MFEKKPHLVDGLLFRDLGPEGILLNPNTSSYYRLCPLAVKILQIIINDSEKSFLDQMTQLAMDCEDKQDVTAQVVLTDAKIFIEKLVTAKIIQY